MAHNYTVARPYARAIFMEAKQANQFSEWQAILKMLVALIADSNIHETLNNPQISQERWAIFFSELMNEQMKTLSSELKEKAKNLIHLLCEKKRLPVLPDIEKLFQDLVLHDQGILNVKVYSAFPLEEEQKEKLKSSLKERFKSKIQLDYQSDPSLIGGTLIRAGDWVLDGSVRGKLERLAESLR